MLNYDVSHCHCKCFIELASAQNASINNVEMREKTTVTLTDIIVALSLTELLSQSKRSEALELLGELLWSVWSKRVAALPAHLIVRLGLAGLVVLALHHVEHVPLRVQQRHLTLGVMGADDVQVVVEPHLDGVVVPQEPA